MVRHALLLSFMKVKHSQIDDAFKYSTCLWRNILLGFLSDSFLLEISGKNKKGEVNCSKRLELFIPMWMLHNRRIAGIRHSSLQAKC